jgi:hypothetical protein
MALISQILLSECSQHFFWEPKCKVVLRVMRIRGELIAMSQRFYALEILDTADREDGLYVMGSFVELIQGMIAIMTMKLPRAARVSSLQLLSVDQIEIILNTDIRE